MKINGLIAVLLASAIPAVSPLAAQTPAERPSLFTKTDKWWASAFFLGSLALTRADPRIARAFADSTVHSEGIETLARNFARLQEGSLTIGNVALWGIGRLAKAPALADIAFHAAESVVAGSVLAQVIRGPLGRSRPWVTDFEDQYDFNYFKGFTNIKYRAYPSIHTVSAFAVATVYTLETKERAPGATWIVGPVAYAIAAGPGLARMYNGQHWASDVLAGAFLGTFAGAKVVRYNHVVKPDNKVNRFFLGDRNVQMGFASNGISMMVRREF